MGERRTLSRLLVSFYRRRKPDFVSSRSRHYLLGGSRRGFGSEPHHADIRPRVAPKKPHLKEAHGVKWNDPYHWMSTPTGKAQLTEHLHGENRYADAVMAETLSLQRRLVLEMEGRMSAELSTPPERCGHWWYYSKVPEGGEFPVYYRKRVEGSDVKAFMSAHEETLLDQNVIARQFGVFYWDPHYIVSNLHLLAKREHLSLAVGK